MKRVINFEQVGSSFGPSVHGTVLGVSLFLRFQGFTVTLSGFAGGECLPLPRFHEKAGLSPTFG
jgi:hypothetical protein